MKKILIVEDDPKIRRILQLELEHEGYEVFLAEDGKEGINKFKQLRYDLVLNTQNKELTIGQRKISLTKTEYRLLELFILNKEQIISREKIIVEIWGYDFDGEEKIVDVYLNSLRKKIETNNKKYIQNIRGFGYMLKIKMGDLSEKDI